MVIVCARENVAAITNHLRELGNPCYEIGEVSDAGEQTVTIE